MTRLNNTKMKVILLGRYLESENLTGPEKVAKRLFAHLPDNRTDVQFITYFFNGKRFSLCKKLFGKEVTSNTLGTVISLGWMRLPFFLLRRAPDILHIVTYERFYLPAVIAAKCAAIPVVMTLHGYIRFENSELGRRVPLFYRIRDRIAEYTYLRISNLLVFVSDRFRQFVIKKENLQRVKSAVIHNGVDLSGKTHASRILSETGMLKAAFIANPSRKEKGFELLLTALNETVEALQLTIVANEAHQFPMTVGRHLINSIPTMDTESLIGFLSTQDILVLPSVYEPFGMVAAEAMERGCVPIVSDACGVAEIIESGINGVVFPSGNYRDLATALSGVILNRELLRMMSERSILAISNLHWQNIALQYTQLYEKIRRKIENPDNTE